MRWGKAMVSICNRQQAIGEALPVTHCLLPIDQKGQSAKVKESFSYNLIKAVSFPLKKFVYRSASALVMPRLFLFVTGDRISMKGLLRRTLVRSVSLLSFF
jgi:hypothetical protein